MQPKVKIYIDWMSQPSRAIAILCKLSQIDHEIVITDIMKGGTKTQEFQKINPVKKVPAILDGDFSLYESHAIMKYLCVTRKLQDQYYSQDPKERARIDCYLDWHHTNTRQCALLVFQTILGPKMGIQPTMDLQIVEKEAKEALTFIDQTILGKSKYIASDQQLTIADMSAYCQIIQLKLVKFNFSAYPNISQWMSNMESISEVTECHQLFNYVVQRTLKPKL